MAFHKYINQEYIERSKGWFKGLRLEYPIANNGLEATNRSINAWNNENPNCKLFATEPSVPLKIAKPAYDWVRQKPDMRYKTAIRQNSLLTYFISPSNEWKSSTLSCPVFLKNNICKHLVGIASKGNVYEFPPGAKDVALGVKRKRGRIPLASWALLAD